MNRQQKSLMIAVAAMLALVLIVILIISLNQRSPEPTIETPEPLVVADTPAPEATWEPLSEEEMGRQAMLEEEQREGEEELPED